MTNFNAGVAGDGGKPTNFQADGVVQPSPNPEDNAVVLEYEGRPLTKTELLKKLSSADKHIEQLVQERKEDRRLLEEVNASLKKQVDVGELLKQMQTGGGHPASTPAASPSNPPVDANTVVAQVRSQLAAEAQAAQEQANWDEVTTKLTQAFGDATNTKVAQMAKDAGMPLEEAVDMARKRPKAFLKMFPDLTPKAQPSALPGSKFNAQSFQKPAVTSGFHKAANTKASIAIYQEKLKALGL